MAYSFFFGLYLAESSALVAFELCNKMKAHISGKSDPNWVSLFNEAKFVVNLSP